MAKTEFILDYKRAREVAFNTLGMYHMNWYPFNKPDIFPDAIVPEGIVPGSKEHFQFLFSSVSLDSMARADQVYKAMRDLASRVMLENIHDVPEKEIAEILSPYFGKDSHNQNTMNKPVHTLISNSIKMAEEYGGDPRRIAGSGTSDEDIERTLRRITEFRQYGIPKAALVMKNAVRFGIWQFPRSRIPIKIDRHIKRISMGTGVVQVPDESWETPNWYGKLPKALVAARDQLVRRGIYSEEDFREGMVQVVRTGKLVEPLTDLYLQVTRKEGIDALELDDAKWAIGAYCCKENSHLFCLGNCLLGCEKRLHSENNAIWFFRGYDKRKNSKNLFKR